MKFEQLIARAKNEEFWNAVDIICGECYGTEETCETCPVRIMCDEKRRSENEI